MALGLGLVAACTGRTFPDSVDVRDASAPNGALSSARAPLSYAWPYLEGFEDYPTSSPWSPTENLGTVSASAHWAVRSGGPLGPDKSLQFGWYPQALDVESCALTPLLYTGTANKITVSFATAFEANGGSPAAELRVELAKGEDLSSFDLLWARSATSDFGPEEIVVTRKLGSPGAQLRFCVKTPDTYGMALWAIDDLRVTSGVPPTLAAASSTVVVDAGGTALATIAAKDQDMDPISWELQGAPEFVTLGDPWYEPGKQAWIVVMKAAPAADPLLAGTYHVRVRVDDGTLDTEALVTVVVRYGGGTLVWAPPGVSPGAASALRGALLDLGVDAQIQPHLGYYPDLGVFDGVFVTLGVVPDTYTMTTSDSARLLEYLDGGGRLYLEGGDAFYIGTDGDGQPMAPADVRAAFDVIATDDGDKLDGALLAVSGPSTGESLGYAASPLLSAQIDRLAAGTAPGTKEVLRHVGGTEYAVVVAHQDINGYRTIASSVLLAGIGGSTPAKLLSGYLDFLHADTCLAPEQCDDGNPCTDDSCTGEQLCTHVPNTLPCDDGDACTQLDGCVGGVCAGSSPVLCQTPSPCHLAGVCNPDTGACTDPQSPDGSPCDDGDPCTLVDQCDAGSCKGETPVVCAPPDDCHLAGTCDPGTGACSSTPKDDGSPCATDCGAGSCSAGMCVAECPMPALTSLAVTPGALTPTFDPEVTSYTVSVPLTVEKLAVTATSDSWTSLSLSGQPLASGQQSEPVLLALGANELTVTVTAGGIVNTYVITVTRALDVLQEAYVKSSNTKKVGSFGGSVALWGDTLAVGEIGHAGTDGAGGSVTWAGAVYIFVREDGSWKQQALLTAPFPGESYEFGTSVSLLGDTLAVGSPDDSSAAVGVNGDQESTKAPESGAVHVFVRDGTSWSHQAYLKASNTGHDDEFGPSVSLSGDRLAVGAPYEDSAAVGVQEGAPADSNDALAGSGAVYVFVRDGDAWSQEAYVKASNPGSGDNFGWSVSLSGDSLAVGAMGESSSAVGVDGDQGNDDAVSSGAVYVFVRKWGSWSQQAYLKASNPDVSDRFGYSVSLSGDTLAVGARMESGASKGVGGDQLDNWSKGSGAVYVFARAGVEWSQEAYIKASNPTSQALFGTSVSLYGETLAVGASGNHSTTTGVNGGEGAGKSWDSGATYLFARSGGTWTQHAFIKASNTGENDAFGESVAIWGDLLVVGAPGEASSAVGINGDQTNDDMVLAGAVYPFSLGLGAPFCFSDFDCDDGDPCSDDFCDADHGCHHPPNTEPCDYGNGCPEDHCDTGICVPVQCVLPELSELTVGSGTLTPPFQPTVTTYAVKVPDAMEAAVVTAMAPVDVTITVSGVSVESGETSAPIPLAKGDNAVTVQAFSTDGAYRTYHLTLTRTFEQQGYIKALNAGTMSHLGASISMEGDTLAVGANGESSGATGVNPTLPAGVSDYSGAAYVFERAGGEWVQQALIKASNTGASVIVSATVVN